MSLPLSAVERAFKLAGSGTCMNVEDISDALSRAGYTNVSAQLTGSLGTQLARMCRMNAQEKQQTAP